MKSLLLFLGLFIFLSCDAPTRPHPPARWTELRASFVVTPSYPDPTPYPFKVWATIETREDVDSLELSAFMSWPPEQVMSRTKYGTLVAMLVSQGTVDSLRVRGRLRE